MINVDDVDNAKYNISWFTDSNITYFITIDYMMNSMSRKRFDTMFVANYEVALVLFLTKQCFVACFITMNTSTEGSPEYSVCMHGVIHLFQTWCQKWQEYWWDLGSDGSIFFKK